MYEINPQQVMMIAEECIRNGWVQGKLKGRATGRNPDEDFQGVCIMGALGEACSAVIAPAIRQVLEAQPEFHKLKPKEQERICALLAARQQHGMVDIFSKRVEQVLGADVISIPSWNDAAGRKKDEVVAAMQATLEIITKECLDAWESPLERAEIKAEAAAVRSK